MNSNDPIDAAQTMARLMKLNRRLVYLVCIVSCVALASAALLLLDRRKEAQAGDELRVREITVVDEWRARVVNAVRGLRSEVGEDYR